MTALTGGLFDDGMDYPPKVDLEACHEPIGELHQLHKQWERDDRKRWAIYNLMDYVSPSAPGPAPAPTPAPEPIPTPTQEPQPP